jgi:hypothetical protein
MLEIEMLHFFRRNKTTHISRLDIEDMTRKIVRKREKELEVELIMTKIIKAK